MLDVTSTLKHTKFKIKIIDISALQHCLYGNNNLLVLNACIHFLSVFRVKKKEIAFIVQTKTTTLS